METFNFAHYRGLGRVSIVPPGDPEDYIPGPPGPIAIDRDEGYEQSQPCEATAGEKTRFVRSTKTLHIQFGNADVTERVVNKFLDQARELGPVDVIVLYVSQDTAQDQGPWLERQGFVLEMQMNPQSSSFVYRQSPARKMKE